jgi:putative ABC transport system permease protein
VETWEELGGFLRDAMALQNVIFTAVVAIMFAIVIAAIVNTSLMTVMERTREIGTLMSLGYRRKHILTLFLAESAVIGGAGGVFGILVGALVIFVFKQTGIEFTLPGQSIATVLYPEVAAGFFGLIFGIAVISALLAALFPAYHASHLKPVDALAAT